MNDPNFQTTLAQAEELYDTAHEEWCKPEEDLVPYTICNHLFESTKSFLIGYLVKNQKPADFSMKLKELVSQCQDLDPKFNELDLSRMYKKPGSDEDYMDMSTVSEFIDLAKQTRSLVTGAS